MSGNHSLSCHYHKLPAILPLAPKFPYLQLKKFIDKDPLLLLPVRRKVMLLSRMPYMTSKIFCRDLPQLCAMPCLLGLNHTLIVPEYQEVPPSWSVSSHNLFSRISFLIKHSSIIFWPSFLYYQHLISGKESHKEQILGCPFTSILICTFSSVSYLFCPLGNKGSHAQE